MEKLQQNLLSIIPISDYLYEKWRFFPQKCKKTYLSEKKEKLGYYLHNLIQ